MPPVAPLDPVWLRRAAEHQDRLTMPRGALGRLLDLGRQLCAIQETLRPHGDPAAVVVFAALFLMLTPSEKVFDETFTIRTPQNPEERKKLEDRVETDKISTRHVSEVVGDARQIEVLVVDFPVSIETAIETEHLMPLRQQSGNENAADVAVAAFAVEFRPIETDAFAH